MRATSGNFSRRLRWIPILSLVVFWSEIAFSSDKEVRYLNFAEVSETLRLFADSALPGSNIADSDAWNSHRSFQSALPSPNRTVYPFAGSGDQSLQWSERILPGLARIHATGSEPASRHVPTSSCSMTDGFVFFARISMGRWLPSGVNSR